MKGLRESLSAAESMGRLIPTRSEPLEFKIPPPPPNPIHETNRQLGQLMGSIEEFRATADEWTKTALETFAVNAKQSLRSPRKLFIPIYLQSRAARAAARNQAALMGKATEYINERDVADKKVLSLLRQSILAQRAQHPPEPAQHEPKYPVTGSSRDRQRP
jgi:hypothetical protein